MGTQPQHALHRTIVVVDVSAFSLRGRNPQEEIRRGLYEALEAAFHDCGLDWSAAYREDRGDGVLVLVPADVPKSRVVDSLTHALLGELRRYNATRSEDARIRLRMAITAGEVLHDEHGAVGDDLTLAFRLLDAKPLRDALTRSTALFALIVSQRFFEDVVRDDPAMRPDSFRRVSVDVKEVHGHAWLLVPEADPPPPLRKPPSHRRKRGRPRAAWALLVPALLFVGLTDGVGATPLVTPPCPLPVQLNVLVSAEKEQLVRRLALKFEKESRGHDPLGCKELNTLVFTGRTEKTGGSEGTGGSEKKAAEALGRGWQSGDLEFGPEPHVWLPDTTAEVRAVEERLRERTDVRLDRRAGVAVSPVVLGASEELAGRIAHPGDDFDWQDVRRLAKVEEVDTSSGAGLAAATALAHAGLGGLELAGEDVPRRLHEITRRMTDEEPCAGDVALVGSERAVTKVEGCRVLYPRNGALVLDHPFVEVKRTERPNGRRLRIVERFFDHLRSAGAQDEFRRDGFRDVAWNIGPQSGLRADRPKTLPVEPDATAVRRAWEAAAGDRVIAVAGDGSADANLFAGAVERLAGPDDRVIPLPLSEHVVEEGAKSGANVVVLISAAAITPLAAGVSRPVRVVAIGFANGACAPSTALSAAAAAHGGECHVIDAANGPGAAEGQELALDGVARAAWGG